MLGAIPQLLRFANDSISTVGRLFEQYEPIVAAMRDASIGGPGTDADRYLRFVMLRFLLLYTTDWSDDIVERLIHEVRPPRPEDDTAVHQILTEMHSGPSPTKDDAPE